MTVCRFSAVGMRWIVGGVMVAVLVATAGCCTAGPESDPALEARVQAHVDGFVALWKKQDSQGLADLFAEDGVRVVSGEQLPATGRAAIKKSFADGFAANGPFGETSLSAKVTSARSLEGDLALAHGTWVLSDGAGDTILNGKWGNVLRTGGKDLQLVLESAHAEVGMDADRSAYATAARQSAPAGPAGTDRALVKAVQDSVDRYIAGVAKRNAEMIADEFTMDGLRLVSSSSGFSHGRDGIIKEVKSEFAAGSPYESTSLSAPILGVKAVSPNYLIAHGVWESRDSKGKVVEFGQWGNALERQSDGSVKMVMECGGGHVLPEMVQKK